MIALLVLFFLIWLITIIGFIFPLINSKHWAFRAFEFPRVQKLIISVSGMILGAYLFAFYYYLFYFLIVQMLAAIYNAYLIFPYTPLSHRTLATATEINGQRIRLLISNVYQFNTDYQKLKDLIVKHKPDICLFVETDEKWKEGLAEATNKYPYKVEIPLDNTYGMLLYSDLELEECEVRHLVNEEFPSILSYLKTEEGYPNIKFYGIHPPPPSPTEETYSTERDREILLVAEELQNYTEPALVIGDLNDVAWSYTTQRFIRVSGLKDPRKGRGVHSTFNAKNWFLRWPLDHIFCSDHFSLIRLKRTQKIGSDHFPVLVDLQLENQNGSGSKGENT